MPVGLDPRLFPEAELSGIRLDGDAFTLGDATVPVDLPATREVRAAILVPEAAGLGLVASLLTAAWVHGAEPSMPRSHRWSVDIVGARPRTRATPQPPQEVTYRRDELEDVAGLTVTTPLRTALDLARLPLELDAHTVEVCARLLAATPLPEHDIRMRLEASAGMANKRRGIDRITAMLATPAQPLPTLL